MTNAIDNWMDLLRDHGDEQVNEVHKPTERSQKMNIYKLSQSENRDYDTFDSMVVMAESEEAARQIHPEESYLNNSDNRDEMWKSEWSAWASKPSEVTVELVGQTLADDEVEGILLASFNAG
jgi:hypothetical protein